MSRLFKQTKTVLSQKLNNPFRYGASAFRYGLVLQGISDHLPVLAILPVTAKPVQLMSWNLLADEHLYNNFMNISGASLLEREMNELLGGAKNNPYDGAMYHLCSELAQYLLRRSTHGLVHITRDKLLSFIANSAQPSLRARSRDPETAKQRVLAVENARKAMVNILMDEYGLHPEYELMIRQSWEEADGRIYYPTDRGAMAGSDYGNCNHKIDGVLSSENLSAVVVSDKLQRVRPVETPIVVQFARNLRQRPVLRPVGNAPSVLLQTLLKREPVPAEKVQALVPAL